MKKLSLEEFQLKIDNIHPKEKLKAMDYNGDNKDCTVQCLICNTLYIKKGGYFTNKKTKSICKKCFPTQPNILKKEYIPREGYILIGEYQGMQNKVLIKHCDCGFIWSVKPNNLESGRGCPKCNRKISKGEQKIIKWLNFNQINYTPQKKINIRGHHLTFDFYLNDYDLYIEYNGEQHYHPVNFFGGENKFKKQIEYDKLKKEFLKDKLLVISYLDFNNIESILKSSTTILKRSTSQATGDGSGKLP